MTRRAAKPAPELLTPEEARKRCRLGRNAVYEAIARGEIPSIRLGRKILIPRVALDRMLAGEAAPTREVKPS